MRRLFILGHPGLYGGASSELHHQIKAWSTMPELSLHCIPTMHGHENEPLYYWMKSINVTYHSCCNYDVINQDDAIINFCSDQFLKDLSEIYKRTKRILWVNCMTFLFPLEKLNARNNYISHYLYQREEVRLDHDERLSYFGRSSGKSMLFKPYFDNFSCEFSVLDQEKVHIGRISRQDLDKYSKDTINIYNRIASPKENQGHFMGFSEKVLDKIGDIPSWIKTYRTQHDLPVKDFYKQVDFIVQSTDTLENLPRIGFEAMFSGKPLVVDNRGGWKTLIKHGVSGFLCDTPEDFIYYGSKLAYDVDLRRSVAHNAYEKAKSISSLSESVESWRKVFESAFN